MEKKSIIYIYILFFYITYVIYYLLNYDTKKVAEWSNNPIMNLSIQPPLLQH